jgi:hypothetical protein
VATAVSQINRTDRKKLYDQLLLVAKRKTATADVKLDQRGQVIEEENGELESDPNVLIIDGPHEFGLRNAETTNGQKTS